MILTKDDLIRTYPEAARELVHWAGLLMRDEMIRRAKEWQENVASTPMPTR